MHEFVRVVDEKALNHRVISVNHVISSIFKQGVQTYSPYEGEFSFGSRKCVQTRDEWITISWQGNHGIYLVLRKMKKRKSRSIWNPKIYVPCKCLLYFSQTEKMTSERCKKWNVLVGCTGSVAAIKIPVLVKKLLEKDNVEVKVVITEHGKHFIGREGILTDVDIITDDDEWSAWQKRGDPVVHIELSKWADLLVIAPLDANTMGKIAGGLCDNLLTCIVRAWSQSKPLVFCPAMNTKMWEHPVTSQHVATLSSWGYIEVPVTSKKLICGDSGLGAMAEIDTIYEVICRHLS